MELPFVCTFNFGPSDCFGEIRCIATHKYHDIGYPLGFPGVEEEMHMSVLYKPVACIVLLCHVQTSPYPASSAC